MTQTTANGHQHQHQHGSQHPDSQPAPKSNETPDLMHEESVPTDGKDVEGEEMMKSVRNDLLKEPPPPA